MVIITILLDLFFLLLFWLKKKGKTVVRNWVKSNENQTKQWLEDWVKSNENQTKQWLEDWVKNNGANT